MKLRLFFYLFLLVFSSQLYSQEGIALYSDYVNDNFYLVHPSMAGASNCTKFRLTARKQWFDIPDSPALQTFTANGKAGENSGVGMVVYNDKNGNHSQTGAKVSYSHHLRLSSDYLSLNHLHLGISAGLAQSRLDERGFDLNIFDPTIGGRNQKDNYFNVDVGASYLKNNFYLHLTYRNVASTKRELYTELESPKIGNLVGTVGYTFLNPDVVMLEPSVLYAKVLSTNEQLLDFNLKAYRNVGDAQLWLGMSFRRQFERAEQPGTDRGKRTMSITPILGAKYSNIMFSYNYSQPLGSLNFSNIGFHQITIGIDLWCKEASYDCNCPAVINVK